MILRVGVENYRSYRDYAELSFVSTSRSDRPTWRPPSRHAKYGVLPVVGLWGANASGKSNFLRAIEDLTQHVAISYIGLGPDSSIPWAPFRLNKDSKAPPTQLDIDFEVASTRYHYGFRFTAARFVQEWLYAYVQTKRRVLFERNATDEARPWYFGPSLGGAKNAIVKAIRPNSLFLSAAAQHNHDQLGPIHRALVQMVATPRPLELAGYPLFSKNAVLFEPAAQRVVLEFLENADLGVVDFHEVENSPSLTSAREAFTHLKSLMPMSQDALGNLPNDLREIWLVHGPSDDHWDLPPAFESAGTHVLLSRLESILTVLRQGGLLVIDELDAGMHPHLCAILVDLFTHEASNPRGAQILFSAQNSGILAHLRTDEVNLIDKNRDGVSSVRAASDYRIRTRDKLQSLYEDGRLRGVPVLGDLRGSVEAFLSGVDRSEADPIEAVQSA
ncbi:MAG: ATP-binding protein [Deltaproteobacteria bacterium]|nr:ATP-binding protein [Deltaproteobacteria bacterium]